MPDASSYSRGGYVDPNFVDFDPNDPYADFQGLKGFVRTADSADGTIGKAYWVSPTGQVKDLGNVGSDDEKAFKASFNPDGTPKKKPFPWGWVAAIVGGIVVLFMLFKKKKN